MRFVRFTALVMLAFAFTIGAVSGQGKDKDKDTKDPKKDPSGKFPSEIAGKDLETWVKEVRDPDPSHRQTAIRAIVQFGPPARKAALTLIGRMYIANEPDASVRADAATALGLLGMDKEKDKDTFTKGIGGLTTLLGDQQRAVRLQAATALGRLGPDASSAVVSLTGTLVDSGSWEVRQASARALASVGRDAKNFPDATALKGLTGALSDACAPVRMEVITALSVLGPPMREADLKMEKVALEDRLVKERDGRVKIWVRILLMLLDEKSYLTPKGLETIAKSLEDMDIKVRCQAAQALGTLGPKAKSQVAHLVEAAKEKDLELALIAITSLGRIQDPAAVPVFTKLLKDEKEDLAVRCQVARAVGALGATGKPLVTELIALLSHKEADLVIAAMQGLSQMGDLATPALPELKKLAADSKDEGIMHTAAETVKFLTTEKPKK